LSRLLGESLYELPKLLFGGHASNRLLNGDHDIIQLITLLSRNPVERRRVRRSLLRR
jgi:hypothetical protein